MDRIFIANPLTKMVAAYITPEALIKRMEEQANHGCGLYYEIYEYRLLCSLRDIHEGLNTRDKQHFLDAATALGLRFDADSIAASSDASDAAFAEARDMSGESDDDDWVDFDS